MNKTPVYLDYNASAPIRTEVIHLVQELMAYPHNASSIHHFGRKGRQYVEQARSQIARCVGADVNNIIFNSGATEGNNTVLRYFSQKGRVLVSAIEHPSVLQACPDIEAISVTPQGVVDLESLESLLKKGNVSVVSVMAVNNETGVIQPMQKISQLVRKYGAYFHCDAVQALGRIALNVQELGIDFLTLSSHKMGGPQGVGALVLGICGETPVLLQGGGQEKKARAGTENVAGIAGFGLAVELACAERDMLSQRLEAYRDQIEVFLEKMSADIIIYAKDQPRVANTLMFNVPGCSSESLLMALDLEGFALSNGSACSSGSVQASHVLTAMAVDKDLRSGTLRLSMGWGTSDDDVHGFMDVFQRICARQTS